MSTSKEKVQRTRRQMQEEESITTKRQEKKGTLQSNKGKHEQQEKVERITGRHRERTLCTLEDPSCVRPSRVLSSRREKRRNSHRQGVGERGGATRRDSNSIRESRGREIERATDRQGKIHAAKPPCVSILRRRSKEKGADRDGKREAGHAGYRKKDYYLTKLKGRRRRRRYMSARRGSFGCGEHF